MNYDFYINNRKWNIEIVKSTNKLLCGKENCGVTHFSKSKIVINKEMEKTTILDTISHELCHAFMFVYGFGQFETFTEENICDMIAVWGIEFGEVRAKIAEWFNSQSED